MRQRQKISLAEWFTRGITIAVFILKRGCNRVKCRLSAHWWRGVSKLGYRGRDAHYWAPPAQIPAGVIHAPGSHLG
jgi:hypothetical protein